MWGVKLKKIFEWINKHKAKTVLLGILLFLAPLIIIHLLFKWHWGIEFLVAKWTAGELLNYVGSYFAFAGTIVLGVLTLWQNKEIAQQSKDHNDILKEMQINLNTPTFNVKCLGLSNNCGKKNISFEIKNISQNLANNISIRGFHIRKKDDEKQWTIMGNAILSTTYLNANDTLTVKFEYDFKTDNNIVYWIYFYMAYTDKFNVKHKICVEGATDPKKAPDLTDYICYEVDKETQDFILHGGQEETEND